MTDGSDRPFIASSTGRRDPEPVSLPRRGRHPNPRPEKGREDEPEPAAASSVTDYDVLFSLYIFALYALK